VTIFSRISTSAAMMRCARPGSGFGRSDGGRAVLAPKEQ
jgi:hypothetical protein